MNIEQGKAVAALELADLSTAHDVMAKQKHKCTCDGCRGPFFITLALELVRPHDFDCAVPASFPHSGST